MCSQARFIYMCICIFLCVYIFVCVRKYISRYVGTRISSRARFRAHTYIYVCVCVYKRVCMYST